MRRGVYVYISGPITAKGSVSIEENAVLALCVHLELVRLGIPNHCPQLVGMYPSASLISWETWIEFDLAIIDRCSHLLMLPKWRESRGAVEEHDYAKKINLPIAYSIPELVEILDKEG